MAKNEDADRPRLWLDALVEQESMSTRARRAEKLEAEVLDYLLHVMKVEFPEKDPWSLHIRSWGYRLEVYLGQVKLTRPGNEPVSVEGRIAVLEKLMSPADCP